MRRLDFLKVALLAPVAALLRPFSVGGETPLERVISYGGIVSGTIVVPPDVGWHYQCLTVPRPKGYTRLWVRRDDLDALWKIDAPLGCRTVDVPGEPGSIYHYHWLP